jgi:hypothetical protein
MNSELHKVWLQLNLNFPMRLKEKSHNFKKGLGNFLGRAIQSQEINEKWMDVIYEYSLVVSSSDGQRNRCNSSGFILTFFDTVYLKGGQQMKQC